MMLHLVLEVFAKYGDRLSSIRIFNYRNGDKNNFNGKLDIGIAGGGIILEGQIQRRKKLLFVFCKKKLS
ncbi:MAG: hypothetical protein IPH97_10330 [Ignavibacteriales bacterium]|nr:hypothetical protein [Ignavibacteriales bacterium]